MGDFLDETEVHSLKVGPLGRKSVETRWWWNGRIAEDLVFYNTEDSNIFIEVLLSQWPNYG